MRQDENAFAQYGTLCHTLLEKWARDELLSFELSEEYEKMYASSVNCPFPPYPKGMPQKYYDAGLEYFNGFDGFGDAYEIVSVEEKFELDIDGYLFVGIADLVLRDKNTGEISVIDHKSKSMSSMKKDLDTYRKQLYIYAMHVKDRYSEYPSLLRFNMFKDGVFIDERFNEETLHATRKWVIGTIEDILMESDWDGAGSSYFCRFVCGVRNCCPVDFNRNYSSVQ